jgi:cytoskeletal protein RodZ
MTSVYSLSVLGNSTIEISQDELRSQLREVEARLHRSPSYRQALASLQNLLGESSEQAQVLFKIVSREAIAIVVRQFALYSQKVQDSRTDVEVSDVSAERSDNGQQLNECLTSVSLDSQANNKLQTVEESLPISENRLPNQISQPKINLNFWKRSQKTSPIETQKIADQKRLESIQKIGQQLLQARESQGLSLLQLSIYTHVPLYHMEAIEKGDVTSLPDDVFVRGFIRVMGNTLGIDGDSLAASLFHSQRSPLTLPPAYQAPKVPKASSSRQLKLELSPLHLYMGYTALVVGAVGGLSMVSGESSNENKVFSDRMTTSTQFLFDSLRNQQANAKPGIKSNQGGVNVGVDIAPPEAL